MTHNLGQKQAKDWIEIVRINVHTLYIKHIENVRFKMVQKLDVRNWEAV